METVLNIALYGLIAVAVLLLGLFALALLLKALLLLPFVLIAMIELLLIGLPVYLGVVQRDVGRMACAVLSGARQVGFKNPTCG